MLSLGYSQAEATRLTGHQLRTVRAAHHRQAHPELARGRWNGLMRQQGWYRHDEHMRRRARILAGSLAAGIMLQRGSRRGHDLQPLLWPKSGGRARPTIVRRWICRRCGLFLNLAPYGRGARSQQERSRLGLPCAPMSEGARKVRRRSVAALRRRTDSSLPPLGYTEEQYGRLVAAAVAALEECVPVGDAHLHA